MELHWIFFTGAPKTGKSTACRILEGKLNKRFPQALIKIESMVDPVAKMAMGMFDVKDSYLQFKRNTYYGKTGREWIIRIAEDVLRRDDKMILDKMLVDRVQLMRQNPDQRAFILCENLGFTIEYHFFTDRMRNTSLNERFSLIHMHRDGHNLGDENDSRIEDLKEYADFHIRHPQDIGSLIPHLT